MSKKISQEEFEKIIYDINNNLKILGVYKGRSHKILTKCLVDGYEWEPYANNLIKGSGCPKCNGGVPYTFDEFIEKLKNCNDKFDYFKIEPSEYINRKSKFNCKCKLDGNEWVTTANSLLKNHGCPLCFSRGIIFTKNHTLETHAERFLKNINIKSPNIKILDINQYYSNNRNIDCECMVCKNVWTTKVEHLNNGHGCPECGKISRGLKRRLDYDFIKSEIENNGFILLSKEYNNCHEKLEVECVNHPGIINKMSWVDFKSGRLCRLCGISKSEKIIESFLIKNKIKFSPEYTFEDCKYIGLLPFDFAIFKEDDSLNFLIESDGQAHYNPVRFGGITFEKAEENFKFAKIRDEIKTKYCNEKGIRLLRIPYWEFNNIENILINQLDI